MRIYFIGQGREEPVLLCCFVFCYYMCILLLLVRVYRLLFVFYLTGCKVTVCEDILYWSR